MYSSTCNQLGQHKPDDGTNLFFNRDRSSALSKGPPDRTISNISGKVKVVHVPPRPCGRPNVKGQTSNVHPSVASQDVGHSCSYKSKPSRVQFNASAAKRATDCCSRQSIPVVLNLVGAAWLVICSNIKQSMAHRISLLCSPHSPADRMGLPEVCSLDCRRQTMAKCEKQVFHQLLASKASSCGPFTLERIIH